MSPVKTDLCNFVFKAPANAEPGTVDDLHCHRGGGVTTSFWQLCDQERMALVSGGLVLFQVHGDGHPVVSLGVTAAGLGNPPDDHPELIPAVAMACARAIETSGIHPANVPAVIGSLMTSLAGITGVPLAAVIDMCREAAAAMNKPAPVTR